KRIPHCYTSTMVYRSRDSDTCRRTTKITRSFFFFFQAEDGIRDFHVTGVQTCALPICVAGEHRPADHLAEQLQGRFAALRVAQRSEERRVGKECRYRWAPDHKTKIKNTKPQRCLG